MAQKTGFTMQQHAQVGDYLRQAKSDFTHLLVGVNRHYPRTTGRSGKVCRALERITDQLSIVCCELEALMAQERPGEWSTNVYYGRKDVAPALAALKEGPRGDAAPPCAFYTWFRQQQQRADGVGALAKEIAGMGDDVPKQGGYSVWVRFLRDHRAGEGRLQCLQRAFDEFYAAMGV